MSGTGFGGGSINIADMIKTQYLFKYLGEISNNVGAFGPLFTLFVVMMYDQIAKSFPRIMSSTWQGLVCLYFAAIGIRTSKQVPLLTNTSNTPSSLPSHEDGEERFKRPPAGPARAYILFNRASDTNGVPNTGSKKTQHADTMNSDLYIDAIIQHVASLPDVSSLEFSGSEFLPNFGQPVHIDNDIWFQLVSVNGRQPADLQEAAAKRGGGFGALFETATGVSNTPLTTDATAVPAVTFRLSSYNNGIKHIHRFVEEIYVRYQQEKQNKLGNYVYYFDMLNTAKDGNYKPSLNPTHCLYTKSRFYTNRTLRNVYFREARALEKRINFFMNRRDWYDRKGVPWTLGLTIWGTPGCGKTSTIKAIANMTGRHIFNISLANVTTREMLKDLFYNDEVRVTNNGRTDILHIPIAKRLYVIEDIDAMESVVLRRDGTVEAEKAAKAKQEVELQLQNVRRSQEAGGTLTLQDMFEFQRKKEEAEGTKDALDLATMLNVFDGIRETPGRVIILSTNHPRRIDPALLRPGRCGDMILQFRKHDRHTIREMIEGFYDAEMGADLLKVFEGAPALDEKWTPAEVSQILFMNMGDMAGAVRALIEEDPRRLFGFLDDEEREQKEREAEMEEILRGTTIQTDIASVSSADSADSDASPESPTLVVEPELEPEPETIAPVIPDKQSEPAISPKKQVGTTDNYLDRMERERERLRRECAKIYGISDNSAEYDAHAKQIAESPMFQSFNPDSSIRDNNDTVAQL